MEPKKPDILEVIELALSAALREVRKARALVPGAARTRAAIKSTSQTATCEDVLKSAGRPMHALALVEALEQRGVRTTRDTLVSALSKRLSPQGPFLRTGPNTFGLAGRDTPADE